MNTIKPFTPIQYIMGNTEFCDLQFCVDDRVLIPRPETELLVVSAMELAASLRGSDCVSILDLCTGSGNIAVSLASKLFSGEKPISGTENVELGEWLTKSVSNCRIVASDISAEALSVAVANAKANSVSDRIEFIRSDLFKDIKGRFDIIVSNPPYIARYELPLLQEEVQKEPLLALDGGDDGLDFYRRIMKSVEDHLDAQGAIIFEIGYGQRAAISEIICSSGKFFVDKVIKDYNEIDRVVIAKWIN